MEIDTIPTAFVQHFPPCTDVFKMVPISLQHRICHRAVAKKHRKNNLVTADFLYKLFCKTSRLRLGKFGPTLPLPVTSILQLANTLHLFLGTCTRNAPHKHFFPLSFLFICCLVKLRQTNSFLDTPPPPPAAHATKEILQSVRTRPDLVVIKFQWDS